ncbi:hypothetical protein LPJ59_004763 [Coemansia sp. RSA 2399]|nr:hypothetical protein LPJ59_004763 [Coemansia sp. RSA 2399]KAJ1896996.1 hypothetical protein LPJ81_004621 [Coemansia sp. IMI 209127]
MSLADLYRTNEGDLEQDESSDDGEFVLEEEEEEEEDSDANDSTSDAGDKNGADDDSSKTEVVDEQRKRRIDDIWSEMNAQAAEKRAGKAPLADDASVGDKESAHDAPGVKEDGQTGEEEKEDHPEPREEPSTETTGEAPRKRRRPVSKFSKMAEMVEQRRTKRENTLDTARRQWTGFVDSQGIRDDLDRANKDGFVERQEFLRRVDERTYQNSKTGQK